MKKLDLSVIYKNGKIKAGALSDEWYYSNNLQNLLNDIYNHTLFLDPHNVSLRERIYYIDNNINTIQLCPYCNKNKLIFKSNKICFTQICGSPNCKKTLTSIRSKEMHQKMSIYVKNERSKKISNYNIGKKLSAETRLKLSLSHIGKKQTDATKKKRINSRKQNNLTWHSDEVKNKISKTNRVTWNSIEYKNRRHLIYNTEYKNKLSNIMKKKILDGEFTPCITNSWTKWKSYAIFNGNIKKFRSNWEAVFWLLNTECQYEKIRIPYKLLNEDKIYIVDFCDDVNKILYEIKPRSVSNTPKNFAKIKFATKWCEKNGWKYVIINDEWYNENAKKVDYLLNPQLKNSMKKFI